MIQRTYIYIYKYENGFEFDVLFHISEIFVYFLCFWDSGVFILVFTAILPPVSRVSRLTWFTILCAVTQASCSSASATFFDLPGVRSCFNFDLTLSFPCMPPGSDSYWETYSPIAFTCPSVCFAGFLLIVSIDSSSMGNTNRGSCTIGPFASAFNSVSHSVPLDSPALDSH